MSTTPRHGPPPHELDAHRLGHDLDTHLLLEASAGTGKTYAIEHLVARLVEDGFVAPEPTDDDPESAAHFDSTHRPARLLALTFTQKAAAEMAARIRATLEKSAAAAAQRALAHRSWADPHAHGPATPPVAAARLAVAVRRFGECVEVATIHGFCQRALVRYAAETGAAFDAEVADAAPFRRDALHAVLTGPELLRDYGPWLPRLLEAAGWPVEGISNAHAATPAAVWADIAERAHGDDILYADSLAGTPVDLPPDSANPHGDEGRDGRQHTVDALPSSEPPRARLDRDEIAARQFLHALAAWRRAWDDRPGAAPDDSDPPDENAWTDAFVTHCQSSLHFAKNAANALTKYFFAPLFEAARREPSALLAVRAWRRGLPDDAADPSVNKRLLARFVESGFRDWGSLEDAVFIKKKGPDAADAALRAWAPLFAPLASIREPVRDFMNDVARRVRRATRERIRRAGALTFDAMVERLADALHRVDPATGRLTESARRLAVELRRRYRFALVDEFQDTDRAQWAIFRAVFLDGGDSRLVVAGDPKQAIYGFRSADVRVYDEAVRTLRAAGLDGRVPVRAAHLAENHRAAAPLTHALNALFSTPFVAVDRDDPRPWFPPAPVDAFVGEEPSSRKKDLPSPASVSVRAPRFDEAPRRSGDDGPVFRPVRAAAASGGQRLVGDPLARQRGGLCLARLPFASEEKQKILGAGNARLHAADFIAREIRRLLDARVRIESPARVPGEPPASRPLTAADCGVLVRGGRDFPAIEQALARYGLSVAYYNRTALPESDAAAALSAVVSALARPDDPGRVTAALLTPAFGLDPRAARAIALDPENAPPSRALDQWHRWRAWAVERRWVAFASAMEHALVARPAVDDAFLDQSRALLEDLARFAMESGRPSAGRVRDRLRRFRARAVGDDTERCLRRDSDDARVVVMTIHASKGLEFPLVFVLGGLGENPSLRRTGWCRAHGWPGSPRWCFVLGGHAPAWTRAAVRENAAEDQRLFYVALTRARLRAYLPIHPIAGTGKDDAQCVTHTLLTPAALAVAAHADMLNVDAHDPVDRALADFTINDSVEQAAGPTPTPSLAVSATPSGSENPASMSVDGPAGYDGKNDPDWTGGFRRPLPYRTSFTALKARLDARTARVADVPAAASTDTASASWAVDGPEAQAVFDVGEDDDRIDGFERQDDPPSDDPVRDTDSTVHDGLAPRVAVSLESSSASSPESADGRAGDVAGNGDVNAGRATTEHTASFWDRVPAGRVWGLAFHTVMETLSFADAARAMDAVGDPDDPDAWAHWWSHGHDSAAVAVRRAVDAALLFNGLLEREEGIPSAPEGLVDGEAGGAGEAMSTDGAAFLCRAGMARMARHALNVPLSLGGAEEGFLLRRLTPGDYRTELSFHLACAPAMAWPPPGGVHQWHRGPDGWIVGSVDLMFRVGTPSRYWIVDWKTNRLPARPHERPEDAYAPEALRREVEEKYALQAAIYALASRRWLARTGCPDTAWGGTLYLFTRGMAGKTGGVHAVPSGDTAGLGQEVWTQMTDALAYTGHTASGRMSTLQRDAVLEY